MEEKTNQEIYDRMIEAFNLLLQDIRNVKADTFDIKDKTDPIHYNVLDIYGFIKALHEKVDKLATKMSRLEEQIQKLEK